MKNIILFAILFILSGCCCPTATEPDCDCAENLESLEKKIDSAEVTWIAQKLAVKWEKELQLQLEDSNVYYGNNIHTLRFEFTSMSILTVKTAREMLVDVVEDILRSVNTSSTIAAELQDYPFTPENLEIYIDFKSFYNIYVDPYKVGFISLECGKAKYWASDVKDNRLYGWHARIEPYFKSREIVQLGRAAEKQYKEQHSKPRSTLDGFLRPQRNQKPAR